MPCTDNLAELLTQWDSKFILIPRSVFKASKGSLIGKFVAEQILVKKLKSAVCKDPSYYLHVTFLSVLPIHQCFISGSFYRKTTLYQQNKQRKFNSNVCSWLYLFWITPFDHIDKLKRAKYATVLHNKVLYKALAFYSLLETSKGLLVSSTKPDQKKLCANYLDDVF